ncbi:MAG: hypothetical protein ACRYFX_28285 [Janthinobacterium lividum]
MKKYLPFLALAASACQPHTAANLPAASAAPAAIATAPAPTDSTAAVLQLAQQVDLAPAWLGDARHEAMEGFYGPDNYRMSFYFDNVRRDSLQPNVFHFRGRDRYKKIITPFTGTITVTRLAALPDTASVLTSQANRGYTAFASFELRETAATKGAGHCQGRATLDFQVSPQHQATQAFGMDMDTGQENPTIGCGLIFEGTWQDNQTGRHQPVAWANYYGVIVPSALAKMGLGMRSEEVNPKLAKYGWNTIMENDEWWADSPKPKLTL